MATVRVVTDDGTAYLKPLGGNKSGPHPLACEWVGTRLAEWFGLPVAPYALLNLDATVDHIELFDGRQAESGPAFVSREVAGHPWGGSTDELRHVENPEAITRLIVFDTWTRNCDRHRPHPLRIKRDNVFLQDRPAGKARLIALDQSCCFTCDGELTPRIAQIGSVKEAMVYGFFAEFRDFFAPDELDRSCQRLREVDDDLTHELVDSIPREWGVASVARDALRGFLKQRAIFVADHLREEILRESGRGMLYGG